MPQNPEISPEPRPPPAWSLEAPLHSAIKSFCHTAFGALLALCMRDSARAHVHMYVEDKLGCYSSTAVFFFFFFFCDTGFHGPGTCQVGEAGSHRAPGISLSLLSPSLVCRCRPPCHSLSHLQHLFCFCSLISFFIV